MKEPQTGRSRGFGFVTVRFHHVRTSERILFCNMNFRVHTQLIWQLKLVFPATLLV